jgi:hypothetical protein
MIRLRYARGALIRTSNRALEKRYPRFRGDLMASAAIDSQQQQKQRGRTYDARRQKPVVLLS